MNLSIILKVDVHLVAPSYTGNNTFFPAAILSYFSMPSAWEECLKWPTTDVILERHLEITCTVLAFFTAKATTWAAQGNLNQPCLFMALLMAGALSVVKLMGILMAVSKWVSYSSPSWSEPSVFTVSCVAGSWVGSWVGGGGVALATGTSICTRTVASS